MPTYLVERYWPGVTSELLLEALSRGRTAIEQMSAEGTRVRDITSVLIPEEEVVFSVYEGPSAEAVRQLNERAGIRVSRIVEAIWISGDRGDRLGIRAAQSGGRGPVEAGEWVAGQVNHGPFGRMISKSGPDSSAAYGEKCSGPPRGSRFAACFAGTVSADFGEEGHREGGNTQFSGNYPRGSGLPHGVRGTEHRQLISVQSADG